MAISINESFRVGFYDFWNRKLRSIVTIVGILLGTMSIIVILSLVDGMKEQSLSWMEERGGIKKITVRRNWE
ncbi:MAG: ABC transporter permease, partial [Candidatus Cloacimonadota bacterium]|nr:ABC transporter permease [Candidatus Cloacimonadota bacterium]